MGSVILGLNLLIMSVGTVGCGTLVAGGGCVVVGGVTGGGACGGVMTGGGGGGGGGSDCASTASGSAGAMAIASKVDRQICNGFSIFIFLDNMLDWIL